jgi:hypothetical protein
VKEEQFVEFCKNYEVRVLNDQKRRARYRPPRFFTDPGNASIVRDDVMEYDTERVFTVEIPESRLKTLAELEYKFYNYQRHSDRPVDLFQLIMDKEREEAHYRHTNAAVQKAYEQYSLMLNLAGYQRKI